MVYIDISHVLSRECLPIDRHLRLVQQAARRFIAVGSQESAVVRSCKCGRGNEKADNQRTKHGCDPLLPPDASDRRVAEVLSASGPVAATRTGRDKRRHRQILTAAWAESLATVHHLRNSVWCGGALRSDDTHPPWTACGTRCGTGDPCATCATWLLICRRWRNDGPISRPTQLIQVNA